MSIPERHETSPAVGGFPGNELEEVLAAALALGPDGQQRAGAGARVVEVLGRSHVWVPLPRGGGPDSIHLDLATIELDGAAFVPVFSSEERFHALTGGRLPGTVAPAVEFARGLPPQVGIIVNPGGAVGIPLPPPAVAVLCRGGHAPLDGAASGGRVLLYEPDWQDEPVDFLAAAGLEFTATPGVRTARRALASVEGQPPALFVGVELDRPDDQGRAVTLDALGRALGTVPVAWPVQLVLLDIARDPVADWMLGRVRPFFDRDV
ncbi:enhanced serine sensitivity protein SseB [Streptomyces sp. NPDC057702]|uniref:enhanced serine sensitivity protein SseB n=1 Tax=unclassified Streptomyces TaxID=2593676 RepID=UPI00368AFCCB